MKSYFVDEIDGSGMALIERYLAISGSMTGIRKVTRVEVPELFSPLYVCYLLNR